MGSPCAVHLYLNSSEPKALVVDQVIAEVARLEHKYSRYRDDSIASAINRAANDGEPIQVDEETSLLLDYANTLFCESDGLFDITSGVLRRAWNFKCNVIPEQRQLDALLPLVGWNNVEWQQSCLRFSVPGMELDFGGYVKEYAADCAAAVAHRLGVRHGLVELGGDVRVIGPHLDGRPWRVGVRHPRLPEAVLAEVSVSQGAVASSGDYERAIVHNGKRYGHILDPRTGWPVSGLVAVTVLADHCLLAGTACTLAMLNGEHGPAWLDQLGVKWLAMNQKGEVLGNL